MDVTLGDPDVFTEGTVQEVLERAEEAARLDVQIALAEAEQQKVAAEGRAELAESETRRVVAGFEAREQAKRTRLRGRSTAIGRGAKWAIQLIGVVCIAIAVFVSLQFVEMPGGFVSAVIGTILVPVALLAIANQVFGTTLMSVGRQTETWIASRVEALLSRFSE